MFSKNISFTIFILIIFFITHPLHAQWSHWAKMDIETPFEIDSVNVYGHSINYCEINNDGTYALTTGTYGKKCSIILWKLPEGKMVKRLIVKNDAYAHFSEYEPFIIYIQTVIHYPLEKPKNSLWDLRTGKKLSDQVSSIKKPKDRVLSPYYSVIDEKTKQEVHIFSYSTHKEICSLKSHINDKNGQIILNAENKIIFADKKGISEQEVREKLQLDKSKPVTQILPPKHQYSCYDIDISPNKKYILFCTNNLGTIYLYSIEEKKTYYFNSNNTTCSCLFIDDASFVIGTKTGEILFYLLEFANSIHKIKAFDKPVRGLVIDEEAGELYSCAEEPEWKVWDLIDYSLKKMIIPLPGGRQVEISSFNNPVNQPEIDFSSYGSFDEYEITMLLNDIKLCSVEQIVREAWKLYLIDKIEEAYKVFQLALKRGVKDYEYNIYGLILCKSRNGSLNDAYDAFLKASRAGNSIAKYNSAFMQYVGWISKNPKTKADVVHQDKKFGKYLYNESIKELKKTDVSAIHPNLFLAPFDPSKTIWKQLSYPFE